MANVFDLTCLRVSIWTPNAYTNHLWTFPITHQPKSRQIVLKLTAIYQLTHVFFFTHNIHYSFCSNNIVVECLRCCISNEIICYSRNHDRLLVEPCDVYAAVYKIVYSCTINRLYLNIFASFLYSNNINLLINDGANTTNGGVGWCMRDES